MVEYPRRTVLGAAALSALGSGGPAAPVDPAAAGDPSHRSLAQGIGSVPGIDRLRDMQPLPVGTVIHLTDRGRTGLFVSRRTVAPADPLEGLVIRSRHTPDIHYARLWDEVHGTPEWFGARVNDWQYDCAAAIEACYALCPITQLSQADYFIRRTLHLGRSWRTIRGVGHFAADQGRGTRIILQGRAAGIGRDDIVLVGSVAQPSRSSEGFPTEIHLADFTIVRDGAATPHGSGDIANYPAGLRLSYVSRCTVRQVASLESSVGFYVGGTVYTKLDDCMAQRLRPGSGGGRDYWCGYYLNGRPAFGFAGGNASIYVNRCLAVEQHPSHVDAVGLRAEGAFVDSFIDLFESARIATGMSFRAAGARGVGQAVDLHVRSAILDGCSANGIDIDLDGTSSASIEITDPYIYAAGGGGRAGISIRNGAGLATIVGGQIHGAFAQGSLSFAKTRGLRVQGTKIHQAQRPVMVSEASALVLEPQISNAGLAATGFAISCRRLERSVVRPTIIGYAGAGFAGGIELDATSGYCEIDGSAIDPGCFRQVDATFKVRFAGSDARGNPAFAARGNVLTGVID